MKEVKGACSAPAPEGSPGVRAMTPPFVPGSHLHPPGVVVDHRGHLGLLQHDL